MNKRINMKSLFFSVLCIIAFNSLSAQNIQGTIVKTNSLEVTIKYKPTTSGLVPTGTGGNYTIGLEIAKGALVTAPSLSILSSIGGSVTTPQIFDDGVNFRYEAVVTDVTWPSQLINEEKNLFVATFGATAGGKFVTLIHNENTVNGYFDFVIPGFGSPMDPVSKFYGANFNNSDPSNSFVTTEFVLPIKLRNFTVGKFGNERVSDLRWSSSSEINSDYFDVERSEDGFNFISIGQQDATGNSSTEQNYAMLDRSLPNSRGTQDVFYYRLKMVDLDGKYEYSDVRSIRFDNENNIDVVAYPNPTSGKLFVNISTPDYDETLSTNAFIYDLSGKLVNKSAVSTKGITEINLDNMTNGAYNIIISHNGTSYQNRIIKTN